jgi:hypothetical protein
MEWDPKDVSAGMVTRSVAASTKIVPGTSCPSRKILELASKPLPVTVITVATPLTIVAGLIDSTLCA